MNKLMCLECEEVLGSDDDVDLIAHCSCNNEACLTCEGNKQVVFANNMNRVVLWDNELNKYRKLNLN